MKSTVVASVLALFVGSGLASSLPGDSALRERDTNIAYTITFTWKDNNEPPASFQCDDDQYLLDCAEEAGFEWPYSRRTGTDTAAAARITSGSVDQSDQSFLDDDQIKAGYVLTDVAYPRSDCTLVIGVEDELE